MPLVLWYLLVSLVNCKVIKSEGIIKMQLTKKTLYLFFHNKIIISFTYFGFRFCFRCHSKTVSKEEECVQDQNKFYVFLSLFLFVVIVLTITISIIVGIICRRKKRMKEGELILPFHYFIICNWCDQFERKSFPCL